MSWFSSSEIETQIMNATSSSIPAGEQDLPLNLLICDAVRSKEANPKEVLRLIKQRIYDINPNVQILALHLLDLLVKNGGSHFLAEVTSEQFVNSYVSEIFILCNQERSPEVVALMLEYLQTWALASRNKESAKYLRQRYEQLKQRKDIEFPETDGLEISDSFLESATAPDWSDSAICMKSGQRFTFLNRKHHCRNCGGVFVQEYCHKLRKLPQFGINIPVRVCDDCYDRLESKYKPPVSKSSEPQPTKTTSSTKHITSNNSAIGSRYTHDLQKAINLSLQTSGSSLRTPADSADEEDEELKQAIAASLAELKRSEAPKPLTPPPTHQQVPVAPSMPPQVAPQRISLRNPLPKDEEDAINEFSQLVETATPHDAVYDSNLVNLSQKSTRLQGKIISDLRSTTNKLATLEDMHMKLLLVSRYYNELLEAELNPDYKPMLPKLDQVSDPYKEQAESEVECKTAEKETEKETEKKVEKKVEKKTEEETSLPSPESESEPTELKKQETVESAPKPIEKEPTPEEDHLLIEL